MIRYTTTEEAVDTARDVLVPVLWVVGAVLVALLAAVVIGVVVRSVAKKSVLAADLARRSKRPLRAVLIVIAVWVALTVAVSDADWETGWMRAIGHVLLIALIAASTWLVGTLAFVVEDVALSRYRVDVKDNRHARRVRTQVQLLRRITVAALVVVGVAAVLLTFPGVSAFGASLLASAGVLSVVAGLAAQSSLANVFAGLQIAFTDGIRVDDVVIVENQWGRIEEITLTYVVVHIWDDRRLILPSTYFTQTPFENWTRRAAELLGTVELDVDWAVPVDDLRAELNRLLADTDLWDHRVGVLQVTDAVGGVVRLRALASAVDAPTLFDLRCYLREGLVAYLQRTAPQALPRTRVETTQGAPLPAVEAAPARRPRTGAHAVVEPPAETGQLDARLFTGSVEAMQRAGSFAGPGEDVIAEREEHAAGSRDAEPAPGRSAGGRRLGVVPAPGTAAVPAAAGEPGPAVPVPGQDPAPTAGATAAPGAEQGAEPTAATGAQPNAGTGVQPTAATGAQPTAGTGVQPIAATGAQPTAATGARPTAGTGAQPTAGTGVQPTAGTVVVPGAPDPVPPVTAGTEALPTASDRPASAPATSEPAPGAADEGTMILPALADGAGDRPGAPTRRSVRSAPRDPRTPPTR